MYAVEADAQFGASIFSTWRLLTGFTAVSSNSSHVEEGMAGFTLASSAPSFRVKQT
jgi:hypothetical protein